MTNTGFLWKLALSALIAGSLYGADPAVDSPRLLWRDPVDLETRNLLFGPGGKNDLPPGGPYQFLKEDLDGTNPKFTVRDSAGTKWKVKLGPEARPETVATRLVWAAGFFADEDYFVDRAELTGVPFQDLHRLKKLISSDSVIRHARFELQRKNEDKKDGAWSWKANEFAGTREWNALRTLMALLNNWDVKDENNTVYDVKATGAKLYVVSDLGASFGTSHYLISHSGSRGNLRAYEHSRFITHQRADRVDFASPGRPGIFILFNPHEYFMRARLEWIGHNIPRSDARWIGTILSRLSPAQIRDAFRSGGYSPDEVEAFARVVERRIAALNAL